MYRNDEAAARARADALQVDLDRSEAELAATKRKLAAAEARLATQSPARAASLAPRAVRTPDERRERVFVVGFVAFLIALVMWAVL